MPRREPRVLLCATVLIALTACSPSSATLPPRPSPLALTSIAPSADVVDVDARFTLRFTRPLNARTLGVDPSSRTLSLALAHADDVDDAFLADLAHPPLAKTRAKKLAVIGASLAGADGTLVVQPAAPMDPSTQYALVVSKSLRDEDGVALADTLVHRFTTTTAPPEVLSTDLPIGSLVVPNRKRFTITFTAPVSGVDEATLHLEPEVEIARVDVAPDRTSAVLELADALFGCDRLAPDATYALVVDGSVHDDEGRALVPFSSPFRTAPSCDATENTILGLVHDDGDTYADISFTTTKPSTTEVDLAGRTVVGAPTVIAGALHDVTIASLAVDTDYDFTVRAEDLVGSVALATGTIHTAPLPPVTINELLADPIAAVAEEAGEFIEIASTTPPSSSSQSSQSSSPTPLDLTGYAVRVTHGSTTTTCALPASPPSLAAGGFVVVASTSFDGATYGGVDESIVARASPWCRLANDVPLTVELLDAAGRVVATMHAPRSTPGRSIERVSPSAPDVASSFCLSRADLGPTPGRANGAATLGCGE